MEKIIKKPNGGPKNFRNSYNLDLCNRFFAVALFLDEEDEKKVHEIRKLAKIFSKTCLGFKGFIYKFSNSFKRTIENTLNSRK